MLVMDILEENAIAYKIVDESKNLKMIKIPDRVHICYMQEKGNQFQMDREIFEYLDANTIPYWLVLNDTIAKKHYLIVLKKENNWVKSCFIGCNKNKIFLGKQVLNYVVSNEDLKKKIKTLAV